MDVPAPPAGRWQRGGDVFGDDGKVTVHGKKKVWAGGGGEGEALAHLGTATSINHSCFLPGDKAQERLLPPLQGHEGELGHPQSGAALSGGQHSNPLLFPAPRRAGRETALKTPDSPEGTSRALWVSPRHSRCSAHLSFGMRGKEAAAFTFYSDFYSLL